MADTNDKLCVPRSWDKVFASLNPGYLAFYKDQKHARSVSVLIPPMVLTVVMLNGGNINMNRVINRILRLTTTVNSHSTWLARQCLWPRTT